jgi:LPS-assembly protein
VKSVPTLYIPIFAYPLKQDQRATGFLFPHFGNSSTKGFNVGTGFFWAMGRSLDQTFYVDNYSKYGWGFGHEFRYARESPSRGTFRSYLFRVDGVDTLDYDLDWSAVQQLPKGFRASVAVRQFSNTEFQRQIQDNLNLASSRRQRASLNVQGSLGPARLQLLADGTETAFGDEERRINRHLPTVRLTGSPRKLGRSGVVFSWEARGEGLQNGTQDGVASYGRLDMWPELSRSFSTSFLQLTPRVRARYTRYTGSLEEANDPFNVAGPALDRRYLETGVELRGPVFSRVFVTEGNFYSDRYKHEIAPEVTWSYRTRVDDFDRIPKFDGEDYALGTNELRYALVNRLLAKRAGAGDKSVPFEFFNWRLQQTYYVQIADDQGAYDPNYSSSAFGPGGEPSHYSPILSRMRFRPTPDFTLGFNTEYDINFNLFRNFSTGLQWEARRFGLNASWNRAKKAAVKEENRVLTRDFLRAQARLDLVPGRLRLDGGGDYDLLLSQMLSARASLRFNVQCCGFEVEMIQYKYNDRDERQFRFSIELANIGSFGSFMGESFEQQGRGGSY